MFNEPARTKPQLMLRLADINIRQLSRALCELRKDKKVCLTLWRQRIVEYNTVRVKARWYTYYVAK